MKKTKKLANALIDPTQLSNRKIRKNSSPISHPLQLRPLTNTPHNRNKITHEINS